MTEEQTLGVNAVADIAAPSGDDINITKSQWRSHFGRLDANNYTRRNKLPSAGEIGIMAGTDYEAGAHVPLAELLGGDIPDFSVKGLDSDLPKDSVLDRAPSEPIKPLNPLVKGLGLNPHGEGRKNIQAYFPGPRRGGSDPPLYNVGGGRPSDPRLYQEPPDPHTLEQTPHMVGGAGIGGGERKKRNTKKRNTKKRNTKKKKRNPKKIKSKIRKSKVKKSKRRTYIKRN